jgi:hypothetical protein
VASTDPVERQLIASTGGLTGWANTEDRAARMAHVRENSPTSWKYHARKLGIDPETCTPEERKRAETARKLYYKRLQMKARVGIKAAKARRLHEQADRVQAIADALAKLDVEEPQEDVAPATVDKPPATLHTGPVHIPKAIRQGGH